MKLLSFLVAWVLWGSLLWAQPIGTRNIIIQKESPKQPLMVVTEEQSQSKKVNIALLVAPKVVGKYANSTYNVAMATIMAYDAMEYRLDRFEMEDESERSLQKALAAIREGGYEGIIAPLTRGGAQTLAQLDREHAVFIPTVHKKEVPDAGENVVFGAIDYRAQIDALSAHMAPSVAVFFDASSVGKELMEMTEEASARQHRTKSTLASYPVDPKGEKIMAHFSKPSLFSKRSVILHVPVVKSAVIAAHMTFTGVRERNILSTQINYDPTLLSLTQPHDCENMIIANSIVEHSPRIYEYNALFNNDISFDWINYATSVGTDYLVSHTLGSERAYAALPLVQGQIVYPVRLVRPDGNGFKALPAH